MKSIFCCKHLDWIVVVDNDYQAFVPFYSYYFTLFDQLEDYNYYNTDIIVTNISIKKMEKEVSIKCNNRSRIANNNPNEVMAVLAEFCTDDFLDQKRNNWCLFHGAAISLDKNNACLFLGSTGTGKSTLAYYLSYNGAYLCTDDMIIIDENTMQVLPFPKPVYLRSTDFLVKDDISSNNSLKYFLRFGNDEIKYPWLPEVALNKPVNISKIYLYYRDTEYKFVQLKQSQAFVNILMNSLLITDSKIHNSCIHKVVKSSRVFELRCNCLKQIHDLINEGDTPKRINI